MPRAIMLVPIETNFGLTGIRLGMMHIMEQKNICVNIFKLINRLNNNNSKDTFIINKCSALPTFNQLKMSYVEFLFSIDQKDMLIEAIIENFYGNFKNENIVIIEGLTSTQKYPFAQSLNYEIAKILNAEIIYILSQDTNLLKEIKDHINLECNNFDDVKNTNAIGVIINKLNLPIDNQCLIYLDSQTISDFHSKNKMLKIDFKRPTGTNILPILGVVPWNLDLIATRIIDIAHHLNATLINKGSINTRRAKSVIFCTNSIVHMIEHFQSGSLLVISADRNDVLIPAFLTAINGIELGGILLTDNNVNIFSNKLHERAFATGLPVFSVNTNIWQTFFNLKNFNQEIPIDDHQRIKNTKEHVAKYIDTSWIELSTTISSCKSISHLSPSVFQYKLTEMARKARKRIVLPEGSEPRTLKAVSICTKRRIATCVLLGNFDEINHTVKSNNIDLDYDKIEIIDPESIREIYVHRLVELRKNKGMTETIAREQLRDNVVLATLMLERGKVDGLVSGAIHTTTNTIRPSLQIIKTEPGSSLISSIFFMLFPEQVYIYGDCAVNLNPNAEQLSEIAIQSADSAITFGIYPYVAMLSYSTGISGSGKDVEKVREATFLVKKRRPDLIIDGPLQYDAAVTPNIAKLKAPKSPVAGRATVFIFPDLNTGNITYKAVQRSAKLLSIGPILQGMRKPVNDLSRGALVEDIVYTIAITAIQAIQK